MVQTIEVIFDGEVLKPCSPVDLKKDEHYQVKIEVSKVEKSENAWDLFDKLAGSVDGPKDWAKEHDHYIYGTPKKK
jgi:predicted DNA-binding antitoxin AbrB/MazE fold protein